MKEFLRRYRILWLGLLPIYIWVCPIIPSLAYILSVVAILWMRLNKRDDMIIIHFLTILILGDYRYFDFYMFKSLRGLMLVFLGIFTVSDLLTHKYSFNKIVFLFFPFFIIAFFSSFRSSPALGPSIQRAVSYFLLIFVSFHYIKNTFSKHNFRFLKDLIYFTALIVIVGLVLAILGSSNVWLLERYHGILGNPNGMGMFGFLNASLYYIYYCSNNNKTSEKNIPIMLFLVLIILSIIISNSRNGLFSTAIFFFLTWLFTRKFYVNVLFFAGVLPLTILFFSSISLIDIIEAFGLANYLRIDTLKDGSGRTVSWTFALHHIVKNLWLGKGFYYDFYVYANFVPEPMRVFRFMSSSWNSYLAFLLNTGIIGTSLFLGAILLNIRSTIRKDIAFAFILAVLSSAMYEGWLSASLNTFTIYFFINLVILQDRKLWT